MQNLPPETENAVSEDNSTETAVTLDKLGKNDANKRISVWNIFKLGKRHEEQDLIWAKYIISLRDDALKSAFKGLVNLQSNSQDLKLSETQLFALAATDVFVEKAQRVLSRRAKVLYSFGVITTLIIFAILGSAIYFIYLHFNTIPEEIVTSTQALIFKIFQSISLGGFVLIALKWLLNLSRSFFHEASSLLERRHALRFGRLYIYLKGGRVDEKQLIEVFQWNKETQTSFLDMNANMITDTLLHRIFHTVGKLPPEVLKALAEFKKS